MDSHLPNTMEWALYLVFSVVGRLIIVCYTTPLFTLLVLPMAAIFHYVQVGNCFGATSLTKIKTAMVLVCGIRKY